MSSAGTARIRPLTGEAQPPGQIEREVGLLAGSLADLLERLPSAQEPPLAGGRSFLLAMYDAATASVPREAREGAALDRVVEEPPSPLARIARTLELSALEVDLILLAGMAEEHEGFASIFRLVHPRGEPSPTAGLAAQLFCATHEDRRSLRRHLQDRRRPVTPVLVEPEGTFFERSLLLAEGLWDVLAGLDAWPAGLGALSGGVATGGLESWFETPRAQLAVRALRGSDPCSVFLAADSEEVALYRAGALAAHAGVPAVLLRPATVTAETVSLALLHAVARGVVPILCLPAAESGPSPAPDLGGHPGCVVLCARTGTAVVTGSRPLITVPIDRLEPPARRRMWTAALPELEHRAHELASRHVVEPYAASEAAADSRRMGELADRTPDLEDVASSLRARAALSVSGSVKLLRPTAGWDQLVLGADRMAQLREAVDRLVHQSRVLDDWGFLRGRPGARGVRMLFSGPSGTGKTLSAEVLARHLGVDLLLVDISRVVSKWIGETEKNLAEVFDVAERAEAVLFFDEADALFGKRTEVSDAHDRYANLETAYLLTRLERFEGLAILSTNLRQNIDQAFLRRLEFVIDFEEPSRDERLALWRCHVPRDAPLDPAVDFGKLADLYPVVGGIIRNAAVAAGFLAASGDERVAMKHFIRAIRREYEKSGRAFPGTPPEPMP